MPEGRMRCHKFHQIRSSGLWPDGRKGRLQLCACFCRAMAGVSKRWGRAQCFHRWGKGNRCRYSRCCAYSYVSFSVERRCRAESCDKALFHVFRKDDFFQKGGFQEPLLNLLLCHGVSVLEVLRLISCRVRDKITRTLTAVRPVCRAISSNLSPSMSLSLTISAARGGKLPMRCSR